MRFWPFGKDKDQEGVEFVSRVVSAPAQDGVVLRAKVTLHFEEPVATSVAEEAADLGSAALRDVFIASGDGAALLGQEPAIARDVLERVRQSASVRSADVVALHVVNDSGSTPPPSRVQSSHPPAGSTPLPSERPPSGSALPGGPRKSSSSQMLAVRESRLIPEGATPEGAAHAIVPLLRDASTRVLVGVLRACDLVIVRGVRLDATSGDDLGSLVPQSTAAPGRFADERRDELVRWEEKLGREKLDALRTEASAIVCYFLHTSLDRAGVGTNVSTALLEAAARGAFAEEGPLSAMPHYLAVASDPTDALAIKILDILGEPHDVLASFTVMLTPVLASLQEDFAFTSGQIKISVAPG